MRKGNLVKLNPAVCFTVKNGGQRDYPLSHSANDHAGQIEGRRHLTEDEVNAWYDSPASKGMNSAGESKLPPRCKIFAIRKDDTLIVERARCRVSFSWAGPTGGWARVLNPVNGESLYVKRELLEVIS
tara:strand:- start:12045 stop:12428 length:384 start_codon:yes stop_codon:yes gene_type:complete